MSDARTSGRAGGRRAGVAAGLALALALGAGCASITPEMHAQLAAPVNCEAAGAQQTWLMDSRAGRWDRFVAGFQGVVPPWSLFSGLHDLANDPEGMYTDHWRVATGEWNDELEAKVDAIHAHCHPELVLPHD